MTGDEGGGTGDVLRTVGVATDGKEQPEVRQD